jgi:hypothetical protein
MGRWLAVAREAEKKSKTPGGDTDRTDKTIPHPVLSVLSVGGMGVSENFSPKPAPVGLPVHRCDCGAIGIIGEGWFTRSPEKARWFCSPCYRRRA